MKISNFLIATGSLIISTRCNLSQHQELLEIWKFPSLMLTNPSLSTLLAPLLDNPGQASELATIVSNCISVGILAMIHDAGQHEKLHAPMVVLAFGASIYFWTKVAAPIDIYLFVIFPWMLMVGLLISRINGVIWEMEDQTAYEKTESSHMLLGL
ncbi:hypothetical protein DSL72_004579 [Monilinia vaccinii-corymbosi]|uniref:Uncharacterized protein n=1 Tax=Monilinia vaccinii-corymbosi TaxID=61207 RepID=A0A8A3P4W9_9HELO|nr:hypothetical protein DSL72_004579 [Monilinia vaccinii-corymbosi]